mmetsp:Transcript_42234/g.62551  ORF Transcript_42234/g.62551 Transcript_42234/m.62551 type:complete len:348 (-) Transcript_42234:131-1174(-)|eukprot:CAMPEP_0194047122 /NCGR_PEP_ID=MMETSP0009_2-20130614/23568_1 /TAXON_ID=210454 /ORGANISM="Grammatophora oceanica, Strain CCMP 410" /LENGTH=347 /DNA_ID=CAMNT_0038692641 /DNA_START=45 /DNA_END=1088 /DNA_ORIENTATION=+
MRAVLSILLILATLSAQVVGEKSFSRGLFSFNRVFGLPRGGGLFGKNNEDSDATSVAATTESGAAVEKFPAMSREEVEEWLEHIPVFAVTNEESQPVVLKPDGDKSVFFFFVSPLMANATLDQLKKSTDMQMKVSPFSLGKIWFNLLDGGGKEITLKSPEDDSKSTGEVEARLIANERDLMGARMLLTMNPEDGEKLQNGGEMTQEMAAAAIEKATKESPKFKANFNEIPVFTILQMRMVKAPEEGKEPDPSESMLPMYFSLENMFSTWQNFLSKVPVEQQGVEPAMQVMALHELVDMMQKECEIDFRNVVLVPAIPVAAGAEQQAMSPAASASPMDSMGGGTLGDL